MLLVTWLFAGTGAKFKVSCPATTVKLEGFRLVRVAETEARGFPGFTRSAR